MSNKVSSYTSWQPLEEVIVGRVYTPDYFEFIEDAQVKDQLAQILDESNEDLDSLQKTIEDYGAVVQRPNLPNKDHFLSMQMKANGIPIPPLTPRDWQITMGEKLLRVLNVPEMDSIIDQYAAADPDCIIDPHQGQYNSDHVMVDAIASCIVRVGEDVFFDNSEFMQPAQIEWIKHNVLDDRYRVHQAQTNGHGDAVFAILKPGVIISSLHDADINYKESFPGWEVCKIWDPTIWAAMEIGKFTSETFNGSWYVQNSKPTENFAQFVDTYLRKWTGFVQETVFDVNCLVLDEQHVIFSSYNKEVFDFCKQRGIEPIISELRHKYFFDGGISCCTQDTRRTGSLERYL